MSAVETTAQWFVDIGAYDVLLPFILIFTITYGTLQKTKTVSTQKNINASIAGILGFLFTASIQLITALQNILVITTMVVIGGILSLILVGTVTGTNPKSQQTKKIGLFLGLITLSIIVVSIIPIPEWINTSILETVLSSTVFITLLVGGFIIWWITRNPQQQKKQTPAQRKQTQSQTPQQSSSQDSSNPVEPKNMTFKERRSADDIDDIR